MTQLMTHGQPSLLGRSSWPQSIFREYLTRNDADATLPLLRVEELALKKDFPGKQQQHSRMFGGPGVTQGANNPSPAVTDASQSRERVPEPQRVVPDGEIMCAGGIVAGAGREQQQVSDEFKSVSRSSSGSSRASETDSEGAGRSGGSPGFSAERHRQEEFILARLHSLLPTDVAGISQGPPFSHTTSPKKRQQDGAQGCDHPRDLRNSAWLHWSAQGVMTVLLGFVAAYIFVLLLTAPHSWNAGTEIVPPRLDAWVLLTRMMAPVQCWIHARSCPLLGFLALFMCIVAGAWMNDSQRWKRESLNGTPCVHCEGLKRSRIMIEEADERALKAQRAKQQFMAYVFHNIRVPFNAIVLGLGHMRAIGSGEGVVAEDSDRIDLLQMMLDCAETMTSVLDDVTDMGQWEDGRMELTNDEFDLLAVIKFLSWGLKDLLDQKQIRFHMQIDALASKYLATHHVVADKHRVVQTLGNFLSNAMKFTPSGGKVELSVRCLEVMEEQDLAVSAASIPLLAESPASPASPSCSGSKLQLLVPEIGKSGPAESPRSGGQLFAQSSAKYKVARLQICVKDTGIGISAEDQEKLFQPYSFVSSGWVQKAGVSGLGLSMAKRFVEQVGGQIGVESKEGEGSTFFFSIPFPLMPVGPALNQDVSAIGISCDSSQTGFIPNLVTPKNFAGFEEEARFKENLKAFKGRTSKSVSSNQLLGAGISNRKRKVLLVEDTAINRIVLRKVLENLNLLVEEAENGKIAVDLARQGRKFDLILMDKEMPVMDGHEATRQLRMMGVKTPIIALTGNSLQSDRELFFEAGVDDFQTKPLSRDKLVQLLARYGVESSCV